MIRPQLEVADVIRSHGDAFLAQFGATLLPEQRRVLNDLARCRTAALGGHVEECDQCGHQQIAYNSCRNRHCPKCQATAAAQWVEDQAADLLLVEYFHVVFTLPAVLNPIALKYPRVVYGLLFRAAAETLQQVAADPKHLGAELGFLAVLHTWGQGLQFHPHVHCVVPGGGLSPDGTRWVACRPGFFLPVRVLSRVFRGKFLAGLRAAVARGQLSGDDPGGTPADPGSFSRLLAAAAQTEWVVYAKPPFGGPEQVLKYLARYTHRVAISNSRLVELRDGVIHFRVKDYAQGGRPRKIALEASEFLRRFLQHVLPTGFVRIRHYGFLAHRCRQARVALCRDLLGRAAGTADVPPSDPPERGPGITPVRDAAVCPVCGVGRLVVIAELPPLPSRRELMASPVFDTS